MSDFVFVASRVSLGSGASREAGDGLLVVGERGAILQVKSRQTRSTEPLDRTRSRAWIAKNAAKAQRQGHGTRRTIERLRASGTPLTALPVRALEVPPNDRSRYDLVLRDSAVGWPTVVILDSPGCEGIELPSDPLTFWITLDDWHELNRAIRSVAGVLTYIDGCLRQAEQIWVPLGHEQRRWAAMVQADAAHAGRGARFASPWFSEAARLEPLAADLYRDLLERVWPRNGTITWEDPAEYRRIVEFLDSAPPALQVDAGRWILRKRHELQHRGRRSSGSMLLGNRLLVYACVGEDELTESEFASDLLALTTTRCLEASTYYGRHVETLGVGVRVLREEGVEYNYQLILEPVAVPEDLRRNVEWTYGAINLRLGTNRQLTPGRNEPCPCLSGRKYKQCHGRER
ncbi:MAG: SEC-C domain-containing protein [Acidimicrobiia bacterium]